MRDPTAFSWVPAGVTGLARLREWDATGFVERTAFSGDEAGFVLLPGREALVEHDRPPGTVSADACRELAAAVALAPPFRALAVRSGAGYAVGAVAIAVVELPGLEGEDAVLVVDSDGGRSLEVDGRREPAALAIVERAAAGARPPYVLRARRLAGETWEAALDPL